MQPLYFLPNINRAQLAPHNRLSREILKLRGLSETFRDVTGPEVDCAINEASGLGPGQKSGVFLAYQTPQNQLPRRLGFYPEELSWHAVGDGSGLWVGIDKASPPTPEEMARKQQCTGYMAKLSDGNQWAIPIVRREDGSSELPQDLQLDDSGNVQRRIKQAFAAYWEASEEVARWMFGKGWNQELTGRALQLAIDVVGLNYRFSRTEQNVLGLIDTISWQVVLALSVDVPKAEYLSSLKKTP